MVGLVITQEKQEKLKKLGVRDSKTLTTLQREKLYDKILKIVHSYKIIILTPQEIDNALKSDSNNLNWLEAQTGARIINELKPDEVIMDCPSPNIEIFKNYLCTKLEKKVPVICAHHADKNYPIVAAASIIAKVTRDEEIKKLKKKYNINFGSGYPSDENTMKFLKENWRKYPEIFRKTWKPYKKLVKEQNQTKLF